MKSMAQSYSPPVPMGKEEVHLSSHSHLSLAEGYSLVHHLMALPAIRVWNLENAFRWESQGFSVELCRHVFDRGVPERGEGDEWGNQLHLL